MPGAHNVLAETKSFVGLQRGDDDALKTSGKLMVRNIEAG